MHALLVSLCSLAGLPCGRLSGVLLVGALALQAPLVFGGASEAVNIKRAPDKATWQYFLAMGHSNRARLWQKHKVEGDKLKDWVWQWRQGWLQSCKASYQGYCQEVIQQGITDPAMVVRARAAEILGDLFEGKADARVLMLLEDAYKNPRNDRHGKPLLVKFRILHALIKIGGSGFVARAEGLAGSHKSTLSYVKKVNKINLIQ